MVTPAHDALLHHLARYRLTTIDAAWASLYAPTAGRDAARIALHRLVQAGYAARFEIRSRSFYQLTKQGCAYTGTPVNAAEPYRVQSLIDRYAVLAFCTLGTDRRACITPEEFYRSFPALAGQAGVDPAAQRYYIEPGPPPRLARLTVDSGADAGRLVRKCREMVASARAGALRDLVEQDRFVLTVLTPVESKQARLVALLQAQSVGVSVNVQVIPEMRHVLGGHYEHDDR